MSVARSEFYCVPQRLNEVSRQSAWNIARRGCSISYVLIYNLIGFQCFTKQNSHDQLIINDLPKIFFGYRTSSHFQLMKAFLNSFKWGQKSIINLQIMKAFGVKSVHMYAILGYICILLRDGQTSGSSLSYNQQFGLEKTICLLQLQM